MEYGNYLETVFHNLRRGDGSLLLSIALKEYSQIEYAKAIGQPANTVGKRYRRAIQKINRYFSKEAFLSMVRGY